MTKTYHTFYDALGRQHFFFGTRDEAEAATKPFSAWGISMAESLARTAGLALGASASNDLFRLSDELSGDDMESGFVHGEALIALMAASKTLDFKHWAPDETKDFRPQYLCWVAEHIGFSIASQAVPDGRFQAIVDAVLKKTEHPDYAAAVAAHEETWVPPTQVEDHAFWLATRP